MLKRLIDRYRIWRIRPGMILAAQFADQAAWSHPNAEHLGPENNLLRFSQRLHSRLLEADEGHLEGLYLNPTTPRGYH